MRYRLNSRTTAPHVTLKLLDLVSNKTFTMSQVINIAQIVGGNTAYVGFTGGTGGLSASQKILSWTYNAQTAPIPNPSFAMSSSPITAINAGTFLHIDDHHHPERWLHRCCITCLLRHFESIGAQNVPTCAIDQSASISGTQPVTATLTIKTTAHIYNSSLPVPENLCFGR